MAERTADYIGELDQGQELGRAIPEKTEKLKEPSTKSSGSVEVSSAEPLISGQPSKIVEPKRIEPADKLSYKITLTKGGVGFRRAYDESGIMLSEFVKQPEKTADYNPEPDQGGVVGKKPESPLPLTNFVSKPIDKTKGILIIRSQGGVGDILNTRMLFEDIRKIAGKRKITYAVPNKYIPLLTDCKYIDNVITIYDIVKSDYDFVKDITDKCGQYEVKHIPFVDKHRSDIWADYIGVNLTNHNQHISFTKDEIKNAKKLMGKAKLKVGIQPLSSNISKDWGLTKWQELVNLIRKTYKGVEIFCYHDKQIDGFEGVTGLYNLPLRGWMASVNECDVILTVATGMFCLANGLHKPTVAIFGSEDLDIYGKYFPEMIPIQRHRKDNNGWTECPCWSAWRNCSKGADISINNQKIPPCLTDISVGEVMKGFEQCLRNSGRITMTKNIIPLQEKKDGIIQRLFR